MGGNIREAGILDPFLAPAVINARLTDKVLSYTIFGNNPDVDTLVEEDVIDTGGDYQYITTAGAMSIVSASANDNPGGSGLGSIFILGLDENWDLQTEEIDLDGITPVVTTKTWIRIMLMYGYNKNLADSAPNTVAAGIITGSIGGTTQATILAGRTSAAMALFTVPRGYTGSVSLVYISGSQNDNFIVRFQSRLPGFTFTSGNDLEVAQGQFVSVQFDPRTGNLKEKSDLKARAQAITNNAQVRVNFTITLIKNDYLQTLSNSF